MAKLTIFLPGAPASECELRAGTNKFGRSLNTDFPLNHSSVSSQHCEIILDGESFSVRDLGSTNGTMLDGKRIHESPIQPGQVLRLGEVELVFASAGAPKAKLRVNPDGSPPATDPRVPPPIPLSPAPRSTAPSKMRRPKNFYHSIPGAFIFPLVRNGLILLVSGTIFFALLGLLTNSGFGGLVGLGLGVFTTGYMFTFMESIITTTAMGESDMPGWPDFESWWESGVSPFLRLLALYLICAAPWYFYTHYAQDPEYWLSILLLTLGLLYLPMALLGVAMYDTVAALNPALIVLSISRVPLEYALTCLILGAVITILFIADYFLSSVGRMAVPARIVGEFIGLYTLIVVTRLVGLLFYTTKERLGWPMGK